MKSRPILFSAPMVRAILAGRKTVTRRVLKLADDEVYYFDPVGVHFGVKDGDVDDHRNVRAIPCPYGGVGQHLWVRETWAEADSRHSLVPYAYRADGEEQLGVFRWRPSIHMPRAVSRITIEITGVRVERLHDITEDEARAEGVTPFPKDPEGDCWTDGKHRTAFNFLWNEINGWNPNAWDANPWVWVVGFRRVTP